MLEAERNGPQRVLGDVYRWPRWVVRHLSFCVELLLGESLARLAGSPRSLSNVSA